MAVQEVYKKNLHNNELQKLVTSFAVAVLSSGKKMHNRVCAMSTEYRTAIANQL